MGTIVKVIKRKKRKRMKKKREIGTRGCIVRGWRD